MELYSNIIGEGKPFLILHGFLGMGDNWKTLGKRFSENGYEVHLIDQRNHGRSAHTSAFSYELMAEDLKDYCDQHNISYIDAMNYNVEDTIYLLQNVVGCIACNSWDWEITSRLSIPTVCFYTKNHFFIQNKKETIKYK